MSESITCPVHGIPDCSPLLNGCGIVNYIHKVVENRSVEHGLRLLLDKYAGRSKWVGFEQPRREAWAEIEGDLRTLLSKGTQ